MDVDHRQRVRNEHFGRVTWTPDSVVLRVGVDGQGNPVLVNLIKYIGVMDHGSEKMVEIDFGDEFGDPKTKDGRVVMIKAIQAACREAGFNVTSNGPRNQRSLIFICTRGKRYNDRRSYNAARARILGRSSTAEVATVRERNSSKPKSNNFTCPFRLILEVRKHEGDGGTRHTFILRQGRGCPRHKYHMRSVRGDL